MGLFSWLGKLLGSSEGETPADVSDRIDRAGDRFRNAGDMEGEQAARAAAADARRADTLAAAQQIEQDFYRSRGLQPDGRPFRPLVGQTDNRNYVRYGTSVRSGGSTGWRYNNPGYLRCNDRSTSYGSIGCDGEYAIFPDERTGLAAMQQHLRTEYPTSSVEDALRQQLPAAEAEAAANGLRTNGVDLSKPVGDVTSTEWNQINLECGGATTAQSGEVFDRGAATPEWVESLWTPEADVITVGDDAPSSPTDNS